jgi:hypothetical protein
MDHWHLAQAWAFELGLSQQPVSGVSNGFNRQSQTSFSELGS